MRTDGGGEWGVAQQWDSGIISTVSCRGLITEARIPASFCRFACERSGSGRQESRRASQLDSVRSG